MIEEIGKVLSIEDGIAEVETIRTSSCSSCRARHGCGHHTIAKVSSSNRMTMQAIAPDDLEIGQQVVVGIPEDTLLQASLWMYCIPLLGLVFGAVLPSLWHGSSNSAVCFSIIGLVVGLLLAKRKAKTEQYNLDYYPQIIRITSSPDTYIPLVTRPS